jgi:ParB/RepB/Spo0J family partition protein
MSEKMSLPPVKNAKIAIKDIIVDSAFNSRQSLDGIDGDNKPDFTGDNSVGRLSDSLNTEGQLSPIIVEARKGGKYYLICGFRRVSAAKKLSWDDIDARVYEPMTEVQRIYLNLMENTARKDLTAFDTAMKCKELISKGETSEKVAGRLGVSDSYVRNLNNSAVKLVPSVIKRWKEESGDNFSGIKICATDWLAKTCQLAPDMQESELLNRQVTKDKKNFNASQTNADGSGTTEPGNTPVATKRPNKTALENILTMLRAKNNVKAQADIESAMLAVKYALGMTDHIEGYLSKEEIDAFKEEIKGQAKNGTTTAVASA